MSTLTAHLSLKKPELTDTVSPEDFNDNFDVLDNEIYDTKKMIEWKQCGNAVSGKTDIQLPASWNEIMIITQVKTSSGYTKQLWTASIPWPALKTFANSGFTGDGTKEHGPLRLTAGGASKKDGSGTLTDFHADFDVYKVLNKVRLARVTNDGVDATPDSVTRVYYR